MTDAEAMQDLKTRTGRVEKQIQDLVSQVTGLVKDIGYIKDSSDKQAPILAALQSELIAMKAVKHASGSPLRPVMDWLHLIALMITVVGGSVAGLTYMIRNTSNERTTVAIEEAPAASEKPPAFVVINGKRYKVSY